MKIKKLIVSGLRAFSQAEFIFQPGMNLLVGINGVGKTTVLDALRICLSKIFPEITSSNNKKVGFNFNDIKIGSDSLEVSCDCKFENKDFTLLIQKKRQSKIENESGGFRNQTIQTPDIEQVTPSPLKKLFKNSSKSKQQPICVYFSTRRSYVVDQKVSKAVAAGGQTAAFAEALLENREFNLRIFAQWFKVQEELGKENPIARRNVDVLKKTVKTFIPEFNNLKVEETDGELSLTIKKVKTTLSVRQLSDGERGTLALVLDIARRLSQANPSLKDPIRDGTGIILIDELDLHLHPKWQRTIVGNLMRTFPNLQFIATTHSPQIIPSLDPENIQLIQKKVIHPNRTLGMDSNWILRFLMEGEERPKIALRAIKKVENLITEADFESARSAIAKFKKEGFDLPEWSVFEARIARLEIIGKDK